MGGERVDLLTKRCPVCRSEKLKQHMTYETKQNGQRTLYHCQECDEYFQKPRRPSWKDSEHRWARLWSRQGSLAVRKRHWRRGWKARVKNKGSQKRKRGRKRPKYQAPWTEHPETSQECKKQDIHANHLEAFFSSLRRKCAAFRRRTNTYAKSKGGLRRILRVYRVIHNFFREHFTTKEVPAVSLGVLERRLSVQELCLISLF